MPSRSFSRRPLEWAALQAILLITALGLSLGSGLAPSSTPAVAAAQEATATPVAATPGAGQPSPVQTEEGVLPTNAPTAERPVPPDAQATTAAAATLSAATPEGPTSSDDPAANPEGVVPPGDPGESASATGQGGDFPWFAVALLSVVALAGLALLFMRTRRSTDVRATGAAASTYPAGVGYDPSHRATTSTTTTTSAATTPVAPQSAAPVAVPVAPPAPAPASLECPNCGTTNAWDENFCKECGEDLRPLRAQLAPVAPTPPVAQAIEVTETTPYLETVSRVDEQLEYVLARTRILIGTAPGNDIIIDSMFRGWQTVSPVHAELRQEGDTFVLIDRGSEAGTFVNEMRTGENILAHGDRVRFGEVEFVYRVPAAT